MIRKPTIYLLLITTLLMACTSFQSAEQSETDSNVESTQKRGKTKSYQELEVYVVGISDGDTFKALTKQKEQIRCRIYGIDAPELVQDFGRRSKERLSQLIFNQNVRIKIQSTDRYGRKVVWVYREAQDVGLEMIRSGMAWHYKKFYNSDEYAEAQRTASKNKVGLWSGKNPQAPWSYRKDRKQTE